MSAVTPEEDACWRWHVVAIHAATAAVAEFDYQAHEVDVFHLRDGPSPPSGHSPKPKTPRIGSGPLLDDAGLDHPGQ
jgi:hypothetical protein